MGKTLSNLKIWASMSAGFKKGNDMALSKTELSKELLITVAQLNGEEQGENFMGNAEDLTMLDKAKREWRIWAEQNNIHAQNTQTETRELMEEAFIDGYLKGFVKRISEGA
jgi:hypothetical protein